MGKKRTCKKWGKVPSKFGGLVRRCRAYTVHGKKGRRSK